MVALQFNATNYTPQYGAGAQAFPPAKKLKVIIVASDVEPTSKGDGNFLALTLQAVEGELSGRQHTDRLNLWNKNAQTVEIANKQLAAYCAVMGIRAFNVTEELHNKPFLIDVDFQKGSDKYTEIKALYDVNGNKPGEAQAQSSTTPVAPSAPPAAQQAPVASQPVAQAPQAQWAPYAPAGNVAPVTPAPVGWGNR